MEERRLKKEAPWQTQPATGVYPKLSFFLSGSEVSQSKSAVRAVTAIGVRPKLFFGRLDEFVADQRGQGRCWRQGDKTFPQGNQNFTQS